MFCILYSVFCNLKSVFFFFILCSVFCIVCCEFYVHEVQGPPLPMGEPSAVGGRGANPPPPPWGWSPGGGGGGGVRAKFRAPPLIKIHHMTPLSARSISLDSTSIMFYTLDSLQYKIAIYCTSSLLSTLSTVQCYIVYIGDNLAELHTQETWPKSFTAWLIAVVLISIPPPPKEFTWVHI
jgi:hypothetical protein